ncbi:MAG: 3-oxoacyl-[acyl-carrier-protein] reductase [Firmicutes bacterium]|nr:3-oxoacyl-[acyl-carrier-protein] reductase [Bacillota bacterium]
MLKEKVALVTGSARGIGRAIALELANNGAKIAVNDLTAESCADTVREIESLGAKAKAFGSNVASLAEVEKMFEDVISCFGRIDILVNNAGITRDNLLLRMKEEDWDIVLNVNLKSVYNCTKAVSKYMMKQRAGRIVNISSVIGLIGNAGQANYAASKAGILGFTRSAARELASRGINVNAVAPGFIQTEMTAKLPEDLKAKMLSQIPLGALGDPEDVAKAVLFLVSDNARYISGQVLNVDGGMVMA